MLSLKLEVNGKVKEYKQKSIKVRAMREMIKFQAKMEKVQKGEEEMSQLEQIDSMILLVADMFDNPEVNFDSILDGIEAEKLEETLADVFNGAMGGEATPKKGGKSKS